MHRFLGLGLICVGVAGGWLLGNRSESEPPEDLPPAVAWRYYRTELDAAKRCEHDVPPHPAAVAALLAVGCIATLRRASRRGDAA